MITEFENMVSGDDEEIEDGEEMGFLLPAIIMARRRRKKKKAKAARARAATSGKFLMRSLMSDVKRLKRSVMELKRKAGYVPPVARAREIARKRMVARRAMPKGPFARRLLKMAA